MIQRSRRILVILVFAGISTLFARAQDLRVQSKGTIADGVHPWYELKADPEGPTNLMICGTKWDAMTNAPFGFVYASSDSGLTWQAVFEDRASPWVTEQSCAWGPNHKAYFVSEASKVIDGQPHHEMGTTRLFVSTDDLKHWKEAAKTGWADYSSSAVESNSGRLYVFFNATRVRRSSAGPGNSIGLLAFSQDGNRVAGPFLCRRMLGLDYHGVYPSDAVSLKNGGVVALYHGTKRIGVGLETEMGLVWASKATTPLLKRTVISRSRINKECLNFDDGALAYDHVHDRLSVVYVAGCEDTHILLTSSDDHGTTWTGSTLLAKYDRGGRRVLFPSLVAESDGRLGLLWSEGSGRWFFAQIEGGRLQPPAELSAGSGSGGVNPNSLWTAISRDDSEAPVNLPGGAPIQVDVRSLANSLWRTQGLVITGDRVLAIWPSRSVNGNELSRGTFESSSPLPDQPRRPDFNAQELDVTRQTSIVYSGRQSFDSSTGTLTLCLAVTNQGHDSLGPPIKLQATSIESPACAVSVLNATNGRSGPGAVWDISELVTGDRVPPGATSSPFCLSIRIDGGQKCKEHLEGEDLLLLKMRVFASTAALSE